MWQGYSQGSVTGGFNLSSVIAEQVRASLETTDTILSLKGEESENQTSAEENRAKGQERHLMTSSQHPDPAEPEVGPVSELFSYN